MAQWFEVDKEGLSKLLARRGKEFILYELFQNANDQQVTAISITLEQEDGHAKIFVEDDDPNGFEDLSHAYTLFAESSKKADPSKAGRFNLGEKLVLAACDSAIITSKKGALQFSKAGGRRAISSKRSKGSSFEGYFKCSRREFEDICLAANTLVPNEGVSFTFNNVAISRPKLVHSFEAVLPTEIADDEGRLRKTSRKVRVDLYEPIEKAYLCELGIPVVETGDKYTVDVRQKIPLNMDRDNVHPSYLRAIRTLVLNAKYEELTKADANTTWVREASSDKRCSSDAIKLVMDMRFGTERVSYDPSDPEANKLAISKGYTVVHGGMLNGQEWENAKSAGAILPAGQVTPSPKPYSDSGRMESVIPRSDWTPDMVKMEQYAQWLAKKTMGVELRVRMTKAGNNFSACYGKTGQDKGELTFNLTVLPKSWFADPIGIQHDRLLIHEFGHQYSIDHLSSEYHEALCLLGAKMRLVGPYEE